MAPVATRSEGLVWINGELVRQSEAKVSIFDRGFVYGDAVFDALRTYRHKPFMLESYLDRFFGSLTYLGIEPGVSRDELRAIVGQVVEANLPRITGDEDLQIVLRCTRGSHYLTDLTNPGAATLIVLTSLFRIDADAYANGVDLVTASLKRTPVEVLSPRPKTHDRLNNVLADLEVKKLSPSARSLMLDTRGYVAEGSSYNIAAVVQGALVTPKDNCLEGRTMKFIVEIANRIGIPARYDDLTPFDLYNSSEAFITGSSNGMLPIRNVDGRTIRGTIPGSVQERLWKEWDALVGLDVREQARRYLNVRAVERTPAVSTAAAV
jgi:branched-chain amino acid aminotransferase